MPSDFYVATWVKLADTSIRQATDSQEGNDVGFVEEKPMLA